MSIVKFLYLIKKNQESKNVKFFVRRIDFEPHNFFLTKKKKKNKSRMMMTIKMLLSIQHWHMSRGGWNGLKRERES